MRSRKCQQLCSILSFVRAIIYTEPLVCQISPRLPEEHLRELRRKLSFTVPNYQFTPQHQKFGWDGKICVLDRMQNAPSGCCYRIQRILNTMGYDAELMFDRKSKASLAPFVHDLNLLPFQKKAVEKALKYRIGIIHAPVRSGKTAIIGALLNCAEHRPAWVVTNGKDLVIQTKKALESHCKCSIGTFSESKYFPGDIVVTSYQALNAVFGSSVSYKTRAKKSLDRNVAIAKDVNKTELLILDECHHAYAKEARAWLKQFKNTVYRIGLSGTPRKGKETALPEEAAIGPVVSRVNFKVLIQEKRIVQPIIYIFDLPRSWYANFMPTYADEYESNILSNNPRNNFIKYLVEKAKENNKTVFVMVGRINHGEQLRDIIPGSVFVQGKIDAEQRKEIYAALQEKKLQCIVGTVGKEGLNLPSLDIVINAEGLKHQVPTVQKMRSLTATEGKKYGVIVDFIDHGPVLRRQSRARLKIYETITGAIIRHRKVPKNFYELEGSRWHLNG